MRDHEQIGAEPLGVRWGTARGQKRIVVGVSESAASSAAFEWAYDVCRRRRWALHVVTTWPDYSDPGQNGTPGHYSDRARVTRTIRSALSSAHSEPDAPLVEVFVEQGDPVAALVAHSRGAELLVIGARDDGRPAADGQGPVCDRCREQLTCPVVVVDQAGASSLKTA